ncbi:DUF29 domain-containing protein [Massilia sp. RP-1-19]|uniref:DUF29 domain-containing protein n=2 Tax=Massilia polaris TaxID=2728846 RepID=A0A848HST1_9BURK|nr:DUF29 domain-containing protein [Massilia polaris]
MPDVDTDFAVWAGHQIGLLRARSFQELDVEHLIEELESLVANDRRELRNRLVVLLIHLLKCQFQATRKSRSWLGTIAEQRDQLDGLFEKSPSLRHLVPEVLAGCYAPAVKRAVSETGLPAAAFPVSNPYSPAEVLDDDFVP